LATSNELLKSPVAFLAGDFFFNLPGLPVWVSTAQACLDRKGLGNKIISNYSNEPKVPEGTTEVMKLALNNLRLIVRHY